MDEARLRTLLDHFSTLRILVVGDFFLDKYLFIDRTLAERSLETDREVHQVVEVRCSPGAAGNVAANLRALDVEVWALSVLGSDGEGFELRRALRTMGVHDDLLVECAGRFTPTYTKPIICEADGRRYEIERLDIKNRCALDAAAEATLLERLHEALPEVDGVIIADQVPERNCGVITDGLREQLIELAAQRPRQVWIADSRLRIGEYRGISLKPNQHEATRVLWPDLTREPSAARVRAASEALQRQAGRPIFVTLGAAGIAAWTATGCELVPAVPQQGEIDIVGAGDSALAGITAGLCSEATPREAAILGNLIASITIQQIGTTGVATRAQVRERFAETSEMWRG